MMQMTGSRRPSVVALVALAVLSTALAGCGRKGPLEAPPAREAAPVAMNAPATPPTP